MSKRKKTLLCVGSLTGTALLAAFAAIPYAYFIQVLAMVSESALLETLCWALYIAVALLLWLAVWRGVYLLAKHWPWRK